MNQDVAELLRQGLALTAVGMGLVFGALALFWGAIALLNRVSNRATATAPEPEAPAVELTDAPSVQPTTGEDARAALHRGTGARGSHRHGRAHGERGLVVVRAAARPDV